MKFKTIRLTLLFSALVFIALSAYQLKSAQADWSSTKWVTIYPINADGSRASQRYIDTLDDDSFRAIEAFFRDEAQRYGLSNDTPIIVKLGPQIDSLPPALKTDASLLDKIIWNIDLRRWASAVKERSPGPPADIDAFVSYYDPASHKQLRHSLGVAKMSLALVNAFSTRRMTETNNVVITHELLHIVGATDKYDPRTNFPIYPEGFAEPDAKPLYPQSKAEIMGGRVPLGPDRAETPKSLKHALIGEQTAREINWID